MFIINIDGVIGWEVTGEDVREQLAQAEGDDIQVRLSTPGGLVSEGILIYNELKMYQGTVDTHLVGEVASMGTYIAMVGNKRTAEPNAVFFIHNVWGMMIGDHREMIKYSEHLDSLTNIMAKEYTAKTGNELLDMRAAMDNDTFYYGDEIKKAGFVDEMVGDADPDPDGRGEAITKAKVLIADCQNRIHKPEIIKQEMKALSVMFAMAPHLVTSTPDNEQNDTDLQINLDKPDKADKNKNINTINQEETPMNLSEIKEKHPEVYAQIIALGEKAGIDTGVNQERTRVAGLLEMRTKFPKAHSQKVIDAAITDGHDTATLSINLMGAEQANDELEDSIDDAATPPANGDADAPEIENGQMTHPDHVSSKSDEISKLAGVL